MLSAELQAQAQAWSDRDRLSKAAASGDPSAMAAWNQWLNSPEAQLYTGQSLSPAARQQATTPDPNGMIFNPQTGQNDIQAQSFWSHPESILQAAFGAALGGGAGLAALGGAGGAGGASGGAASAAGGGGVSGIGDFVTNLLGGAGKNLLTNGIGSLLSNVGQTASGGAAGLANQRSQQAQLAAAKANAGQTQYQDVLNQYLMKGMENPLAGAEMAKQGDLLANVQDVKPVFTPGSGYSFTGGIRPSALGPNARQAGQNLSNAGLAFQSGQGMPQAPDLTSGFPSTTPGSLESILSGVGGGASILGSLMGGNQSPIQQLMAALQKQGGQQNQGPNPVDPNYQTVGPPDPNDPSQFGVM